VSKKLTDKWGFIVPVPEIVIERWREIGTNGVALFVYLRYRTNRTLGGGIAASRRPSTISRLPGCSRDGAGSVSPPNMY